MSKLTISIIVLGVTILILMFPLLQGWLANRYYKFREDQTDYFLRNLGWLISVVGPIRTGKSSLQSGMAHVYQVQIQQSILELFQKVKSIYSKIDFNEINNYLNQYFINHHSVINFEDVAKLLIKDFNLNDKSFIFDYLGFKTLVKNFTDYSSSYYAYYFRNNYVASKTRIYSHITGNYNLDYNLDSQKIYEAYDNGTYDIDDWLVELADELTDEFGSAAYYSDIKDESGAKDYRRKYGHIHQERNRFITTKQDVSDEVKKYRKLTQSNLEIQERVYQVGGYRLLLAAATLPLKVFRFFNHLFTVRLRYFFSRKVKKAFDRDYWAWYDYNDNRLSVRRKIDNLLYFLEAMSKHFSYNVYRVRNYQSEDDVGKDSKDYQKAKLFIKTPWCYGTYDQFEFSNMQQELFSKSKYYTMEIDYFYRISHFIRTTAASKGDSDDSTFNVKF